MSWLHKVSQMMDMDVESIVTQVAQNKMPWQDAVGRLANNPKVCQVLMSLYPQVYNNYALVNLYNNLGCGNTAPKNDMRNQPTPNQNQEPVEQPENI